MNIFSTKQFIPRASYAKVRSHQYKGGSDSILYSYIWSPLTQYMCEHLFPAWLAPNLITITGFFAILSAALLSLYHSPDFSSDMPTSVLFYDGFAILIYQILDNADGKQARKTKSSSPLGMLFDHGCDTLASPLVGIILATSLKFGETGIFLCSAISSAYVSFFIAMWQQYQIGEMRLGYINAIDEGLVYIEGMIFTSAICGQNFWL